MSKAALGLSVGAVLVTLLVTWLTWNYVFTRSTASSG